MDRGGQNVFSSYGQGIGIWQTGDETGRRETRGRTHKTCDARAFGGEDQNRVAEVLLVQVEAQPQDEMLNRTTFARGVWMELQKVRKHGTERGEQTGRGSGELTE